jgi:ABC-type uncharacterized transport system ATPase subunit
LPALVEMDGIVKRFGVLTANDHVSLAVERGEVHALLGENGAGKTTLMNVLYGLTRHDEGTIRFNGTEIAPRTPADAIDAGIGMVHQHPLVVGPMTVAENLFLGGLGDGTKEAAAKAIAPVTETIPLEVDFGARVDSLPMSQRQRLEIVRCLARGVELLILDEPTAVLTPEEVGELFTAIRQLRADGKSVILITHKLSEVKEISDRTTVLRRGANVGTFVTAEKSTAELAAAMVGGDSGASPQITPRQTGRARLELNSCTVEDKFGHPELLECSLAVHEGEIVGIAGVEGNGQKPLADVLFGVREPSSGTATLDGKPVPAIGNWRDEGVVIGRIPEDRRHDGLVLEAPLWQNLLLGPQPHRFGQLLPKRRILAWAEETLTEYGVTPPNPNANAAALSGGNQQKVIIARELCAGPEAVVAVNPTRGLDLRSQLDVQRRLVGLRDNGVAVLVISTDLDEIFALIDRVAVLYRGRLLGPFRRDEIDRDRIGLLMGGIEEGSVA